MRRPPLRLEVRRLHVRPARALENARGAWTARASLLVRVVDEDGLDGWGECSPLPGFSPDSLEACAAALTGVALEELGSGLADLPAARFAVESALLDLRGKREARSASALLGATEHASLGIAALLPPASSPAFLDAAREAIAAGHRTLKAKLDGARFEADLTALRQLRRALPASIRLRLDANGSLEPSRLEACLHALAELAPEFLEEPVPAEHLGALHATPVPLALDESLSRGLEPTDLLRRKLVSVLVLKPALLGGLAASVSLARQAQSHGARVVVSHLWEGPVAMAACAALALALAPESLDAGLGRHPALEGWPRARSAAYDGCRLVTPRAPGLGIDWEAAP